MPHHPLGAELRAEQSSLGTDRPVPAAFSAGGGDQRRKPRPVRGQGGEDGKPRNKRREMCLEGDVAGWPMASHPLLLSPWKTTINQPLALALAPWVQQREHPALRPLHAPTCPPSPSGRRKQNLDHRDKARPVPPRCTPRFCGPTFRSRKCGVNHPGARAVPTRGGSGGREGTVPRTHFVNRASQQVASVCVVCATGSAVPLSSASVVWHKSLGLSQEGGGGGGGGATWAVFRSVGHFPPEWVPMDAGWSCVDPVGYRVAGFDERTRVDDGVYSVGGG